MFNAEAVAARKHATALALLPKTFDSLRAIYGHSGPSVLPLSQVSFSYPSTFFPSAPCFHSDCNGMLEWADPAANMDNGLEVQSVEASWRCHGWPRLMN